MKTPSKLLMKLLMKLLLMFAYLTVSMSLSAQTGFTSVTAIVQDPSGNIYANAPYNVTFFDPGTSGKLPTLNNSPFQRAFVGANTDSFGNLAVTVADNGVIASTSGATNTQWRFSICAQAGTPCFSTLITITGASQNITATLKAAAAPLTVVSTPASLTASNIFTGGNTFTNLVSIVSGPLFLNGNAYIDNVETGISPSGLASHDLIYPDNVAHRLKMNNNNTGADVVVGAATPDTLTNKVMTGASNGNNITLLNAQGPLSPVTGNSTDQTLFTYTLPASTIATLKGIRVRMATLHTTGSASVNYKIYFGSTGTGMGFSDNSTNPTIMSADIINTTGITAQTVIVNGVWTGNTGTAFGSPAENTANSVIIKGTFNVANTDAVTPKLWTVELIQ